MAVDFSEIRGQFPQLKLKINGKSYIYLDSAATTLKPQVVIDRISKFYSTEVSNVHRGAHHVSHQSTLEFERAREVVASFIGANSSNEIIFTRSTTESINLASHIISQLGLIEGDEILLSEMEHHSNVIPWQLLKKKLNLIIKYIPFNESGELNYLEIEKLISKKTKVISVCHISNTLGTENDLIRISEYAKSVGAFFVVDAAQSISVTPVDVSKINCDFLAFSGHKLFAPFGIGVLWGKEKLLNKAFPYQGGGSMIHDVEKDESTYLDSPQRYEAGTPNVAGAIGLSTAIEFVQEIGFSEIQKHEKDLLNYAMEKMKDIEGLKMIGTSKTKVNVISFIIDGVHHSDLSQLLDQQAIAVRAGHHCTQLIIKKLNISGTIRASFSIYNNREDVDAFVGALIKARNMLL